MIAKNEVEIQIIREYCKRSFYNFFKLLWGELESIPFEDSPHIKVICDALQARYARHYQAQSRDMTDEYNTDLIINVPPGASKSMICSVYFPVWVWLLKPSIKFITLSYSYKISEELASKSLKLIESKIFQQIKGSWSLSSTAVGNIKNTRGGLRFTSSIGGSITGIHADIQIVDDGNNPAQIYSSIERNNTKRFFNEVLPSRKTSLKASFLINVQQRLHPEDITGLMLENTRAVDKYIIPAIDKDGKPFCSRYPMEFLEQMKLQLGTIQFNAQYQQITQNAEGGIIKREWVQFCSTEPKALTYFIDSAYGGKNSDYNAILGAYKDGNNIIIHSLELNKMEFPQLLNYLKTYLPPRSKVYIEGKASGRSIVQVLRQSTDLNIIESSVIAGKIERKHSISPMFEAGRVFINDYIKFKENLLEQLTFDSTAHDDALDVLIMCLENMGKSKHQFRIS